MFVLCQEPLETKASRASGPSRPGSRGLSSTTSLVITSKPWGRVLKPVAKHGPLYPALVAESP